MRIDSGKWLSPTGVGGWFRLRDKVFFHRHFLIFQKLIPNQPICKILKSITSCQ
jgi:hypothetical protein